MSLTKAAFVFLVSACFKKSLEPPNAVPPRDEQVRSRNILFAFYSIFTPTFMANAQLISGIIEAAIIVSSHNPNFPISKLILSLYGFISPAVDVGNPEALLEKLSLSTMTVLGGLLILVGTVMRLSTYKELGKFFHVQISIQKDHKLVTSGLYSVVRHPSYTALMFLINPGWVLFNCGGGGWIRESGVWKNTIWGQGAVFLFILMVVAVPSLLVTKMSVEDDSLRQRFGKSWEEWSRRVPYKLVPYIY